MWEIFNEYDRYLSKRKYSAEYWRFKSSLLVFACLYVAWIFATVILSCFKLKLTLPFFVVTILGLLALSLYTPHAKKRLEELSDENYSDKYSDFYKNFTPIQNKVKSEIYAIYQYCRTTVREKQASVDKSVSVKFAFLTSVVFSLLINVLPDWFQNGNLNNISLITSLFLTAFVCWGVYSGWQIVQDICSFSQERRIKRMQQLVDNLEGVLETQFQGSANMPSHIKKGGVSKIPEIIVFDRCSRRI